MLNYSLSATARKDLDDIWDFYLESDNEAAAELIFGRLYNIFDLLSEFPAMGRPRPEYALGMRSHKARETPYIVFYFPTGAGIEITQVMHGSRDIARHFR